MLSDVFKILMDTAKTKEAKRLLSIAQDYCEYGGYYDYNDWEEMTWEEKIKEVIG